MIGAGTGTLGEDSEALVVVRASNYRVLLSVNFLAPRLDGRSDHSGLQRTAEAAEGPVEPPPAKAAIDPAESPPTEEATASGSSHQSQDDLELAIALSKASAAEGELEASTVGPEEDADGEVDWLDSLSDGDGLLAPPIADDFHPAPSDERITCDEAMLKAKAKKRKGPAPHSKRWKDDRNVLSSSLCCSAV